MKQRSNRSTDPRTRTPVRAGATLIDVAMGSMLLAIVLIPTVRLIRESERTHRERSAREVMLFEAERLIQDSQIWLREEAGGRTNFASVIAGGRQDWARTIATPDAPPLASRVILERDTGLGSVAGQPVELVTISVSTWQDRNGNRREDVGEPAENLKTQWTQR